jgi:hypothetical protein
MSAQVLEESDSEREVRQSPANPGGGALVGVRLNDRYDIWPSVRLADLDVPGATAYGASDLVTGNDKLFALVCDGHVVPRTDVMGKLREIRCAELMSLLDWGTVPWSFEQQAGEPNRLVVIYERPAGERLVDDLFAVLPPMSEYEVLRAVFMPAVAALSQMDDHNVTHRGIRPTNLFYRDGTRQSIMFGDCVTTPPAYAQPALFESIESAMASPAGRGPGLRRHDIYSLGVTLLFLLLGRRPAPDLDDEALLAARLANGSYTTLVGKVQIPVTLREPLRGMLQDDPDQRWELEDLEKWLVDRRLKPAHPHPAQKALRPFNFEGQNFYNCRSLANAIARQWRSHVMTERKTELLTWIERSLGDGSRRDAVERAYEQLSGSGLVGGGSGPAIFNARLAMALDPMAPLRYKGFAATMEGIGPALAAGFGDSAKVQEFAEIVRGGLPIFWLDLQRYGDRDLVRAAGVFRRLGSYLKDPRPGSGIERCLYELNPGQHCLSPCVEREHVVAIEQVLPALERNAPRDGMPFDRHLAAFIAARLGQDISGALALASNRENPTESTIGLLALFATLQWQLGPTSLPNLTRWLASSIQPIVAGYHHRSARKRIESELPNLIKGGSLVGLYNFLVNSDLRRQDEAGFAAAVSQYAKTEFEIAFLESGGASDPARAIRYGRQLAAACSAALGALALIIFTLARL